MTSHLTLFAAALFLFGCANHPNQQTQSEEPHSAASFDTMWRPDKSEYDLGHFADGKKNGMWKHYFVHDSTRMEERYYVDNARMVRCCSYRDGKVFLEENYLGDGVLSLSYYSNGALNSTGYHRTVDGIQGEADGRWVEYDSLGNLFSETMYDYHNDKIIYREYEPSQHFLTKECEYFQESGEATCYKNGDWKFYRNGKPDRTEHHNMEATLDAFGK